MPRKKERVRFDDDNPEWSKEDFAQSVKVPKGASLLDAARMALRKRGRPKSDNPKKAISVRLDADVLAAYRKLGSGWQSAMNADLRKARKLKAG
jgi:uncharacterized protein (DUF4415 family)